MEFESKILIVEWKKQKLKEMSPDILGLMGCFFLEDTKPFMCYLKRNNTNELTLQNGKWLKDLEKELMVADGKGWLGSLEWTCTHCSI